MKNDKTNIPNLPPLDRSRLSTDQVAQLDTLRALEDIASMFQEALNLFDKQEAKEGDSSKKYGALLVDIRDTLTSLNSKEAPELPDSAAPVVAALSKLESSFTKAINAINVSPVVNVDAPQVNVSPTPIDLKGIEKILKTDIPDAFRAAIEAIPPPEKDDYSPLLDAWAGISQQLLSLENATRMKPLPGSIKVTNPYPYGFAEDVNLNTEIVTVDTVKVITQTDGVKTSVTTIDSTDVNDKLITRVWSINGI